MLRKKGKIPKYINYIILQYIFSNIITFYFINKKKQYLHHIIHTQINKSSHNTALLPSTFNDIQVFHLLPQHLHQQLFDQLFVLRFLLQHFQKKNGEPLWAILDYKFLNLVNRKKKKIINFET